MKAYKQMERCEKRQGQDQNVTQVNSSSDPVYCPSHLLHPSTLKQPRSGVDLTQCCPCRVVDLCSLQIVPVPVPALSDSVMSMLDYLAPGLECNIRHVCWGQASQNGRRKNREGQGLETTKECDRSIRFPGLYRILLLFHQRVLTNSMTTAGPDKEKHQLALGQRSAKGLQRTQSQNVQPTHSNEPRSIQNVLPPNGHVDNQSWSSANSRS